MNIVKSAGILLLLLIFLIFVGFYLIRWLREIRDKSLKKQTIIGLVCWICTLITGTALVGDYVYPFERNVPYTLIAEFEVPSEYELAYPGQQFWHGAYKEYGIWSGSFYFDAESMDSKFGFGWPPMDFDHYNYIITYGQEIKQLSYNVWDEIDTPYRTGAKVGHMFLEEAFSPEKVYIYRIPRIRIENDINDLDRPWD